MIKTVELTQQQNKLFTELAAATHNHIQYLSSIGLGERAKGIKFSKFSKDTKTSTMCDLASFENRTAIPHEVYNFNPHLKNTIITTDPNSSENKHEDLQKILDIRLYPTLRNLIKQNRTEVFLGSTEEMIAYYASKNAEILFEFQIPSSATYYLAMTKDNELFIIMAGLVSRENIIAQLLTLKLAKINLDTIEIIGQPDHFGTLVNKDIDQLTKEIPALRMGNNILIVAGCGLENIVSELIHKQFLEHLEPPQPFKGISFLLYTFRSKNQSMLFMALSP